MGDRLETGRLEQHRISADDLFEGAPDAIVAIDEQGLIVRLNHAAERLFGYHRDELTGRPFDTIVASRDEGLRKDATRFAVEVHTSRLAVGPDVFVIAAIRDGSGREQVALEKREGREQALRAEMSRQSKKDALTGLPNRAFLHDRIAAAIASARQRGHRIAVMFLDLDRFKHVNDSLGHAVGDWLLESVALRLTAIVGPGDTVSRQGGDEFIVLLSEVRGRDEVTKAATAVMSAVTGLHRIGAHELHVNASMGIACYPEDGEDSETLIQNADTAMYDAKSHGRDNFQFFTPEMNAHVVERHALEHKLRGALSRGELVLYYQPKVDLGTGAMIGAEALLRWRQSDGMLVGPERFVPVAEDSGLIVPIGRWVLREVCRQARAWQDAGLRLVPLAVNVSGIELRNKSFLDDVRRILRESGLDPHYLEVELTESVLMASVGATSEVLRQLKAMGLRVAVDDFGTGYSSLSYLAQFPIDALKMDQSFVRQIENGEEASPIIAAVIRMGKGLKHRVIAEGVETAEQAAFLRAHDCEEGQGFHFSRPLDAGQFAAWLVPAREADVANPAAPR